MDVEKRGAQRGIETGMQKKARRSKLRLQALKAGAGGGLGKTQIQGRIVAAPIAATLGTHHVLGWFICRHIQTYVSFFLGVFLICLMHVFLAVCHFAFPKSRSELLWQETGAKPLCGCTNMGANFSCRPQNSYDKFCFITTFDAKQRAILASHCV